MLKYVLTRVIILSYPGGRPMPMTSKEMVKLLKKHGFKQVPGGKGSHQKYYNPVTGRKVLVPYHNVDLSKGTERSILKQAGLER